MFRRSLTFDILLHGVLQAAMVSYVDADDAKRLLLRVPMRTALADLLVRVRAAQDFRHDLLVVQGLERFVQTLHQRHEELYGILLFA